MDNKFVDMIHNSFDKGYNGHINALWKKVNLKALMLLFAHVTPPISQAKVAASLNLSKVTLSRWVTGFNKKDNRVQKEWIPVLENFLDNIDDTEICSIIETLNILQEIKLLQNEEKMYASVCTALKDHFLKKEQQYIYDSSYLGKPYMLRFYHDEQGHRRWWYFLIVNAPPDSKYQQLIDSDAFSFFKHMPSILPTDRVSTVYSNANLFSDVWYSSIKRNDLIPSQNAQQFQSLFLCDPNTNSIIEERIISLPASDYHYYLQ